MFYREGSECLNSYDGNQDLKILQFKAMAKAKVWSREFVAEVAFVKGSGIFDP